MRDFTRSEKKQLRALSSEAYRRELHEHLRHLDSIFGEWRSKRVDEFALSEAIHVFHHGPARDLFSLYNRMDPGYLVARAVGRRILAAQDVPNKILDNIQGLVDLAREHADEPGDE